MQNLREIEDKQWEDFLDRLEAQQQANMKAKIEEMWRTEILNKMATYVLESRVVPPPPPQPPSNVDYIDDFKRIGEGDVEIWMRNRKAPMEYYPDGDAVRACTIAKKAIPMLLEDIYYNIRRSHWLKFKIAIFFLRRFLKKTPPLYFPILSDSMIKYLHYLIENYILKPERYSRPVREIYRVLTLGVDRELYLEQKDKFGKLRDLTCFFLEYDSAYRRRFMDMFSELKVEELKPSKSEMYWENQHIDYDFGGLTIEERKKKNVEMFGSES